MSHFVIRNSEDSLRKVQIVRFHWFKLLQPGKRDISLRANGLVECLRIQAVKLPLIEVQWVYVAFVLVCQQAEHIDVSWAYFFF